MNMHMRYIIPAMGILAAGATSTRDDELAVPATAWAKDAGRKEYDADFAAKRRDERRARRLRSCMKRGERITPESLQWLQHYEAQELQHPTETA